MFMHQTIHANDIYLLAISLKKTIKTCLAFFLNLAVQILEIIYQGSIVGNQQYPVIYIKTAIM